MIKSQPNKESGEEDSRDRTQFPYRSKGLGESKRKMKASRAAASQTEEGKR